MDPDAPHREKLPLHDLDAQVKFKIKLKVDFNLTYCIFNFFRMNTTS